MNLCTKFDKNRTKSGSATMDTSLKVSLTGSKLTRLRVYYFRCYWPSNLAYSSLSGVTYISNLRKIGQKLRSLSRTIGISDRHTAIHSSDFISVQRHALHWTDNNSTSHATTALSSFLKTTARMSGGSGATENAGRENDGRNSRAWNCKTWN